MINSGMQNSPVSFKADLKLDPNIRQSIADKARDFQKLVYSPLKEQVGALPNTEGDTLTLSKKSCEFGPSIQATYKFKGEDKPVMLDSFTFSILFENAKTYVERVMNSIKAELHKRSSKGDNEEAMKEMGI
ncbi:MAG: hypothetical protein AB1782_11095 [Cyanobacteriota bacterium]